MAYFRAGGQRPSGNAALTDVKAGRTFSNDEDVDLVGSMPDNGAINKTLNTSSTSYTVPEGYHNGSGKVQITTQTKTVTATTSAQNVTPDSGKVLSKVTINPQNHTGTYSPTNRAAALDMGANNNYRYVNTNSVPNSNSGTYTFASGDTGGTKDMGAANTYRYVNAANVYAKGKADGASVGHGSFNDNSDGQTITINLGFNPKAVYLKHTGANGRHFVVSYDNNYNSSNFELLDNRGSGIGTYASIALGGTTSEGYNISFNVTNNGFTFKSNSAIGTAGTWYYCASN